MNLTKELENILKASEKIQFDYTRDPRRYFYLRPSSFPYCGFRKALEFDFEKPLKENLASSYFTGVGTSAHSTFQRFMGKTGSLVGDWECKKCGNKTTFSTNSICKKCGSEMLYEELELRIKNTLLGHTDGLVKLKVKGKAKYFVIDFKTTSLKKVYASKYNKTIFPLRANVYQIQNYVPALEIQYSIKIDGYALIYLPRDLPLGSNVKIVEKIFTEEEKENLHKALSRTIKIHRRALVADTKEDYKLLEKYKLCKSAADYKANWHDTYSPCPYAKNCFSDMKKIIKDRIPKGALIELASAPIRKELGL